MAFPNSWLSDLAVTLQLQELGTNFGLINKCPDPERARRWIVMLCFIRADPQLRMALADDLRTFARDRRWMPTTAWIAYAVFDLFDSPADYPFCLNEQEFAFYAKVNFGGEMGKLPASFKPPSFYRALAQDALAIVVGAGVGALLISLIPEWATAGAVAKLAPGAARATIGGAAGVLVKELLPGNALEASRKTRLWNLYTLELKRRSL